MQRVSAGWQAGPILEQPAGLPLSPRVQLTHWSVNRKHCGGGKCTVGSTGAYDWVCAGWSGGSGSNSSACAWPAVSISTKIARRRRCISRTLSCPQKAGLCREYENGRKISGHFRNNQISGRCDKLFPVDFGDLVGLGAAGGDDLDRGALLLADQRARERRGDGDAALLGVGLGFADDLVDALLLGVLVDQRAGRTEHNGVARQLRDVDD